MSHKGRLDQRKLTSSDFSISYVSNEANFKGKNQIRSANSRNKQGNQRNSQTYRCRGGGGWNNNNRIRRQICEKYSHTIRRCYFRFDQNYVSNQQSNSSQRNYHPNSNLAHASQIPRIKEMCQELKIMLKF